MEDTFVEPSLVDLNTINTTDVDPNVEIGRYLSNAPVYQPTREMLPDEPVPVYYDYLVAQQQAYYEYLNWLRLVLFWQMIAGRRGIPLYGTYYDDILWYTSNPLFINDSLYLRRNLWGLSRHPGISLGRRQYLTRLYSRTPRNLRYRGPARDSRGRNLRQRSTSPSRRAGASPRGRSPRSRGLSPTRGRTTSPTRGLSPRGRTPSSSRGTSPMKSPGRMASPRGRTPSPTRGLSSPRGRASSPVRGLSPRGRTPSPGRMTSPSRGSPRGLSPSRSVGMSRGSPRGGSPSRGSPRGSSPSRGGSSRRGR